MKTTEIKSRIRLMYNYSCRILPMIGKNGDSVSMSYKAAGIETKFTDISTVKIRSKMNMQCGSLFAMYPNADPDRTMSFAMSMQAISDYLDNFCRLTMSNNEADIRRRHLIMLEAVDPDRAGCSCSPDASHKGGGDYLRNLVDTCRQSAKTLPSYDLITGKMKKYVQLYTDLQVYKNFPEKIREEYLKTWSDYYIRRYPGISCWEFSTAACSTMGINAMYASAHDPELSPQDVNAVDDAYFPWICGLHKLLEAYIEARQDMQTGRLNFTHLYRNLKQCEERIVFFAEKAVENCKGLKYSDFHLNVVKGLLALYLSDPRAFFGMSRLASRNILAKGPPQTELYWQLCKFLRHVAIL